MKGSNLSPVELLKFRLKKMHTTIGSAIDTVELIGDWDDERGALVVSHQQLQKDIKKELQSLQSTLNKVEAAYDKMTRTFNPHLKPENEWKNFEKPAGKCIQNIHQFIDKVSPALQESDRERMQEILTDIQHSLEIKEVNLIDMQEKLARHTLKIMLDDFGKKQKDKVSPSVFISYSWDNAALSRRVHRLAKDLKRAGIQVILDIWHNRRGSVMAFIERIMEVDFVVVVGTPGLVTKWQNYVKSPQARQQTSDSEQARRLNIVALEVEKIGQRVREPKDNKYQFINDLLAGSHEESFPSIMGYNSSSFFDISKSTVGSYLEPFFNILNDILPVSNELTPLKQELVTKYQEIYQPKDEQEVVSLYQMYLTGRQTSSSQLADILKRKSIPIASLLKEEDVSLTPEDIEELVQRICRSASPQDEYMAKQSLLYTPVRGTFTRNSIEGSFDLEQEVEKFVEDNNRKVLLLLGYSGSGKTMFCQHVFQKKASEYLSSDTALIPIYISLPSLSNPKEHLIETALKRYGFGEEQMLLAKKTRKFLFILDSYDEVPLFKEGGLVNLFDNNQVKNYLTDWQAHFIISCRTNHFVNANDYAAYFVPYENERPQFHLLREINIAPFKEKEISEYINNYVGKCRVEIEERINRREITPEWLKPDTYQDYIQKISGLEQLIEIPFLLKVAMDILPETATRYLKEIAEEKRLIVTAMDLYDQFVEQWFIRQKYKFISQGGIGPGYDIKKDYKAYSEQLAKAMDERKLQQVSYEDESELTPLESISNEQKLWAKFFGQQLRFFKDGKEMQLYQRSYKGCPLRKFDNTYAFIHPLIQDYFISRKILEDILNLEDDNRKKETKLMQENNAISSTDGQSSSFQPYRATQQTTGFFADTPMAIAISPKEPASISIRWYEVIEIDKLLKHYLKERVEVEILFGLLGTDLSNGNMLEIQLQQFELQQKQAIQQGKAVKDKVLIPINLHQGHWVLLYITYPRDLAQLPAIIYFDPKGKPVDSEVHNALNRLHPGVELINASHTVQADETTCGVWVVEAARTLIANGALPDARLNLRQAIDEHQQVLSRANLLFSSF